MQSSSYRESQQGDQSAEGAGAAVRASGRINHLQRLASMPVMRTRQSTPSPRTARHLLAAAAAVPGSRQSPKVRPKLLLPDMMLQRSRSRSQASLKPLCCPVQPPAKAIQRLGEERRALFAMNDDDLHPFGRNAFHDLSTSQAFSQYQQWPTASAVIWCCFFVAIIITAFLVIIIAEKQSHELKLIEVAEDMDWSRVDEARFVVDLSTACLNSEKQVEVRPRSGQHDRAQSNVDGGWPPCTSRKSIPEPVCVINDDIWIKFNRSKYGTLGPLPKCKESSAMQRPTKPNVP